MKKIVITGANGFLGKSLVTHLTDFEIGSAKLLDVHPITMGLDVGIPNEQHTLDLSDRSLHEYIEEGSIVIHLAWRSNPSVTGADVPAEMGLNWDASQNLIDACTLKNAKLVFVSSGGTVYGKSEYLPIDEKHPAKPVSAYGIVKLKVEEAVKEASQRSGLKYVIVRPSNLYGPGFSLEKGLGVIGHWVEMVKTNQAIKMIGEGKLVRDFVHIDDLCRGILSCLDLENETLNLGSGNGTSLHELSLIFEKIIGYPLQITRLEERNFDVETNFLSIEKVLGLTNWSPQISLETGIRQLLND